MCSQSFQYLQLHRSERYQRVLRPLELCLLHNHFRLHTMDFLHLNHQTHSLSLSLMVLQGFRQPLYPPPNRARRTGHQDLEMPRTFLGTGPAPHQLPHPRHPSLFPPSPPRTLKAPPRPASPTPSPISASPPRPSLISPPLSASSAKTSALSVGRSQSKSAGNKAKNSKPK